MIISPWNENYKNIREGKVVCWKDFVCHILQFYILTLRIKYLTSMQIHMIIASINW